MTAIEIYAGNRLETLAGRLADETRRNPLDPFEPERVVVPHPTLGRWLVLALAKELGIAANISIELPAQFAWSMMRDALGNLPTDTPFAPDRLRWRIYEQVASLEGPGTAPVREYLEDGDSRKRFELADRLSHVYDRCLLYRPDWIRAWERGEAPHWQAKLWQRVTEGITEPSHWVAAIDAFRAAAATGSFGETGSWPTRVSFFGVAALSPSYLDLLRQAGEYIDVRLYMLSPCEEYWSDIAPRRVIQRRADPQDPAEQYRTEGNELLSAWGKLGRDMQNLLLDDELSTGSPVEHYDAPSQNTSLGAVQRDILDLRLAAEAKAVEPADVDDSIQIHVCHSAMREAEVLHDRLLGIFDDNPDIQPADVLVLTPNIVDYAPAIEAVFGAADAIPFNIARPRASATRAIQAFLDLLALPDSRYGAEAAMAPLESAAVRDKFRIAERDLSTLRECVSSAGIRWGIDADHREDEGLPRFGSHAWRQGLDRLLLGYAMDGEETMFRDVAPCSTDSAGFSVDYGLLGRFVDYCECVMDLRSLREQALAAGDWSVRLHEEVARFFSPDWENAPETGSVTRLIDGFEQECDVGSEIPFAVLRDVLGRVATRMSRPAARLGAGMTVASLSIGQAFPAKVVCALGMNDRLFPRRPSPSSFDLVDADGEKTGDRNARDEDRFAFLETLLATRRFLLVSYTGRNVRDDKPVPPSVVVDELRDYLGRRFEGSFDIIHPLQPFSRTYFEPGGNLWSYSASMLGAARTLVGTTGRKSDADVRKRFAAPAGRVDKPRTQQVDLGTLIAFFGNPTRAFVRERLGIRLEIDEISLDEEEPFELDGLEQWKSKSEMFQLGEREEGLPTLETLMGARGFLPAGGPGRVAYENMQADVEDLRQALGRYEKALAAEPREIAPEIEPYRLTGAIENVAATEAGQELVRWRIGSTRAKDSIGAWLELLAWAAEQDVEAEAHLVCLPKGKVDITVYGAPSREDARRQLKLWLDAYSHGTKEMLAFSPNASMAYALDFRKNEDHARAWAVARNTWHDERSSWDEMKNIYVSLAYDGEDPTGEEQFGNLARTLLGPLVEAQG